MSHSPKKQLSHRNVAAMARQHAGKAIATIAECMDDPDPKVRLDAASRILDRGIGKPIAMTADVSDRLDDFTDDELASAIADLKRRISSADDVGEGTGETSGPQSPGSVSTLQ